MCAELLHQLWIERHRIVNEYLMSKVRIEDYCNLLYYVKELRNQVDVRANSALHWCEHQLNKVGTEILRGIVHGLLAALGIGSR